MKRTSTLWISSLMVAWLAAASAADSLRHEILGQNLQLSCAQPIAETLSCDYRLLAPDDVVRAFATIDALTLKQPILAPTATLPGVTAVAVLIDTSNPAYDAAIAHTQRLVLGLLRLSQPRHRFAIATFGEGIQWVAPLGSPLHELQAALAKIKPAESHAELFRNAVRAVRLLAEAPARRRALVIFSGAEPGQQAFSARDVIDAAKASGIIIFTVAYTRTTGDDAHQALQLLSRETGGEFSGTDASQQGDGVGSWAADTWKMLDNGGNLSVDLGPAIAAGLSGPRMVRLSFELSGGLASAQAPVIIRAPSEALAASASRSFRLELARTLGQRPAPQAGDGRTSRTGEMLWYITAALGAAILLAVAVIVYLLIKRGIPQQHKQQPQKQPADPATRPAKLKEAGDETFGFLEMEDGTRHMLDSDAYLIGRHSSNDLTIVDASVSRQHAEIHRRPDGFFTITDLDSMNGVFVDNQQLKHAVLKGGELLELGDVACRFRLVSESELTNDDTVMLADDLSDEDDTPRIA